MVARKRTTDSILQRGLRGPAWRVLLAERLPWPLSPRRQKTIDALTLLMASCQPLRSG